MASSIGSVACDLIKGPLPALKQRIQIFQSPGIDGYAAQTLGKGDSEFRIQAVKYGSLNDVNTWDAALDALQGGAEVTITDDDGVTHANMLIVRVGPLAKTAAVKPGSNQTTRGEKTVEGVRLR